MSWQAWLSIAVVNSSFVVLAFTRLPSDVVFLSGLGLLLLTGVLETGQALAGFSSSSVMTVGLLYVVVAGLQETGGLIQLSQRVLGAPTSYVRAQLRLTLPVSLLSAFLNNTPVVAMFIPTVMEWSRRIRIPASKLLIPLSYASIFGGLCTLIGTSTNLVVNDPTAPQQQLKVLDKYLCLNKLREMSGQTSQIARTPDYGKELSYAKVADAC